MLKLNLVFAFFLAFVMEASARPLCTQAVTQQSVCNADEKQAGWSGGTGPDAQGNIPYYCVVLGRRGAVISSRTLYTRCSNGYLPDINSFRTINSEKGLEWQCKAQPSCTVSM